MKVIFVYDDYIEETYEDISDFEYKDGTGIFSFMYNNGKRVTSVDINDIIKFSIE